MAYTESVPPVAAQDASPATKVSTLAAGGVVRSYCGELAFNGATAAQTYCIARVPARARVRSIKMTNAAMTSGSLKIGLFRSTPHDSTNNDIDDDVFSTAVDLNTARTGAEVMSIPLAANRADDLFTAFSTAITTASATYDQTYDIVASVVTVAGSASGITFDVEVVLPE